MYKRTLKAIMKSKLPEETSMCDAQFGAAKYSSDVAFAITTRVDANGASWIFERNKMENQDFEPNVLTPKRTEYGKSIRKDYESGNIMESRHNMTKLEPRNDGISNTLTSVQKDNLVVEPSILQVGNLISESSFSNPQRGRVYSPEGLSPTLDSCTGGNLEKKILIPQATEQGYVEVEPGGVFDGSYPNSKTRRGRVQEGGTICPTLTSSGEPPMRFEGVEYKGKIIHEGDGLYTGTSDKFVRGGLNGVSRTLKSGMHDAGVCDDYRIRKLTPRECFRLMGVTDEDVDKIQAAGISNSQQYKMAGNSIVVDVLFHIFRKMFVEKECESGQLSLF